MKTPILGRGWESFFTALEQIYYESIKKILNEQFATNLELLTEEGEFNYVGYLLSDTNAVSLKVARYAGKDRAVLKENNDYGFCSLIKATKQILDKLEVENTTLAYITAKERKENQLWNAVAMREAIINAIVHNDYTQEIMPKFELFDDRVEITSSGGLPQGISEQEFFEGYSVPRNKELMRVFRDLELVESLGSGIPRILRSYGKECFFFTENFVRMVIPITDQATDQAKNQVIDKQSILEEDRPTGQPTNRPSYRPSRKAFRDHGKRSRSQRASNQVKPNTSREF